MTSARAAPPNLVPAGLAAAAGLLAGAAFPPFDLKWLVWVALVPLVLAVARSSSPRAALGHGYTAGLVFFLSTLHPLVSAHSWIGWAAETPTALSARMTKQWWFLQVMWILFAIWCASFWALWAWGIKRLASRVARHG